MRAVVLLSGGMDSLVTMALALRRRREVIPIAFSYGQTHAVELTYAHEQVAHYRGLGKNVWALQTHTLPDVFRSLLTRDGATTAVPNRNAVMMAVAVALAESLRASEVWAGLNRGDPDIAGSTAYADAGRKFAVAFDRMTSISTAGKVSLVTPFVDHRKFEVALEGVRLRAPVARSWSCLFPQEEGEACGACSSCKDRMMAFLKAGIGGK